MIVHIADRPSDGIRTTSRPVGDPASCIYFTTCNLALCLRPVRDVTVTT